MLGKQISNVQVYGDQTVSGQNTFTDNIIEQGSESIQGSLNVKGLTKMKGGLTLESGAITLPTTISIPLINQLGYSFSGTLTSGGITAVGVYTIASITIPSGVWLLNSQLVMVNGGTGATTFTQIISSISTTTAIEGANLTLTRANAATAQNSYTAQHNVRIVSLTESKTYYLIASVTFTTTVTLTYQTSYLTATRIA